MNPPQAKKIIKVYQNFIKFVLNNTYIFACCITKSNMFRKVINILVVAFFLLIMAGINLNIHFCHHEFVSASINHASETCGDKNCNHCSDTTISIRLEQSYLSRNCTQIPAETFVFVLPVILLFNEILPTQVFQDVFLTWFYPPGKPNQAVLQVFTC